MKEGIMRVRGSAHVSQEPDWVVIRFSILTQSFEYEKCMNDLASQTDRLRTELETVGLSRAQLKTTDFDIKTDYERINQRRVFNGYKASHNLRIEFSFKKDFLNQVMSLLSRTKSQADFTISFEILDPETLRQKAIAKAVANSREKAMILAQSADVSLGDIVEIDYSWSEVRFQSDFQISEMACFAAPDHDLTPEDVNYSDSVTVIWKLL